MQLRSKRNKAADGSKGSKGLCCRCWCQQAQWQEGSLSTFRLGKEGPETCESTAALLIRNKCLFSIWMRYLKSPHFEDTQGKETPTWFSEQLSFILSDVVAAAAIARSVQEPHLIMQKMQKTFRTTDGAVCNIWSQINTFSSTKAMSLAPEHCHWTDQEQIPPPRWLPCFWRPPSLPSQFLDAFVVLHHVQDVSIPARLWTTFLLLFLFSTISLLKAAWRLLTGQCSSLGHWKEKHRCASRGCSAPTSTADVLSLKLLGLGWAQHTGHSPWGSLNRSK